MSNFRSTICLCAFFLIQFSVSGCNSVTGIASFQPAGTPLEVSVNSKGDISFSVVSKVSVPTFLGVFSIGVVANPSDYFRVSNTLTVRVDCKEERFYDLHGTDFDLTFQSGYYEKINLQKVGTNLLLDIRSKDIECSIPPTARPPTAQIPSGLATSFARQTEELVRNQEFYLAASVARVALQKQPNNAQAAELLQRISDRVAGGLVTGGQSGIYYPFGRAQTVIFIEGLGGDLAGISPDGQRGLILNRSTYSVLNFANGNITSLDEGIPSTDLNKVDILDISAGIVFRPMRIKNVLNGSTRDVSCTAYDGMDRWMHDSRLITQLARGSITVVDTESGSCRGVEVPGLRRDSGTAALTDGQRIWIVLPGSYNSMENGQLFVMNIDGSGLKKLGDLPVYGRDRDSRAYLAPDSSAIYLSEGLMASTRTGRVVESIANAIGWVEADPPKAQVRKARLTVLPKSGPRGTWFAFQLEGGEPGMEVVTSVRPGGGGYVYWVDVNGRITDNPSYRFGFGSDIKTATGTHIVEIISKRDRRPIATATFTVTEP